MATIKKIFKVTGLSQFGYNANWQYIDVGGSRLVLKPQPDNRYDANAIGVYLTSSIGNDIPIGWIAKKDNPLLQEVFKVSSTGERRTVKVICNVLHTPVYESDLQVEFVTEARDSLLNLPSKTRTDLTLIEALAKEGYKVIFNSSSLSSISNTALSTAALTYPSAVSASVPVASNQSNLASNTIHFASPLSTETVKNIKQQLKEISPMAKIMDTNKQIATQAAYNEAGRIFLNQVTKAVAKQAPLMVKGYVDTPAGKLVLANAAVMAVQHFRGQDARLNKLANAALAQAYQEMYKAFDIEAFIEGFLDNETIKAALNTVGGTDE